jgi:tellurite resistance protein TehA-like permease
VHTMTPVWVFPAYPLLLAAPFAHNLIGMAVATHPDTSISKLEIAFCAVAVQGTGFLISFMVCSAFLYRLMTQKLPRDAQRPGVFISIGPGGFTCAGIVSLGTLAPSIIPSDFLGGELAIPGIQVLSLMLGIWLWGLSCWFFLVSVGSLHKYLRPENSMPFQMTWWSFVFPNTALITATEALGIALQSEGLRIMGCVLAGILVIVWLVIFAYMIKAIRQRAILWPKGHNTD